MPLYFGILGGMSLEHFAEGAQGARHVIKFMAHTAPVTGDDPQRGRLYRAENRFKFNEFESNPATGLSTKSSKELLGEVVHHTALNDVPGIDELRKSFDPLRDATTVGKLTSVNPEGVSTQIAGAVVPGHSEEGRNHVLLALEGRLGNRIARASVTHEASHLALLNATQLGHFPTSMAHNWPMARLHLNLVHKMFGLRSAQQLKDHYESLGVDFGR